MFESLVSSTSGYLVGLFFIIIAPARTPSTCCEPVPCAAVWVIAPPSASSSAMPSFSGAYLGIASLICTTPLLFILVRYIWAPSFALLG